MNAKRLMDSLPGKLWAKMNDDNAFNWAVILAWNFLQSLFPIVLVVAAVLGVVLGFLGVGSAGIYRTVASLIPDPKAQKDTFDALNNFHQKSGIFFLVGFAGLVWSGTGLFRAMEQGFAVIYHTRQRPLFKGILMSVGMVFLLAVFGGLMLVTTALLGLLNQIPYLPSILANGTVVFAVQAAIGVFGGFVLYLAIYYVVPNRKMDWGSVWVGAAIAGVLFEILSLIFPLYLRLTGAGSGFGKTFGLLFLLMLYFYYIGIVTMVGVEINSLLYPIPVDQPEGGGRAEASRARPTRGDAPPQIGKESLVTPVQGPEPAPLQAPADAPPTTPDPPRGRRSRVKGLIAISLLWLTGPLRRKPRTT
jgi:membrane protein